MGRYDLIWFIFHIKLFLLFLIFFPSFLLSFLFSSLPFFLPSFIPSSLPSQLHPRTEQVLMFSEAQINFITFTYIMNSHIGFITAKKLAFFKAIFFITLEISADSLLWIDPGKLPYTCLRQSLLYTNGTYWKILVHIRKIITKPTANLFQYDYAPMFYLLVILFMNLIHVA